MSDYESATESALTLFDSVFGEAVWYIPEGVPARKFQTRAVVSRDDNIGEFEHGRSRLVTCRFVITDDPAMGILAWQAHDQVELVFSEGEQPQRFGLRNSLAAPKGGLVLEFIR